MDESVKLSDAATLSEATDDATKLHQLRQNKQALRKLIRSRIKSVYPTKNNTNTIASQTLLLSNSNQVFSRLFELPQYKHAKSIGFFLSMPSGEIQTKHAIQQIVKDGKVLYVPRVGLDFELCDMDLIRCDTSSCTATVDDAICGDSGVGSTANADDGGTMFYDSWPRNKWGIPEPPLTTTNVAKPGDIDLLIVPGLAFDTNGHRLGQGKGYYDRFIAKMRDGESNNDIDNIDDAVATNGQTGVNSAAKPLLVGVCLEEQFLDELPHGVDFGDGCDSANGIVPVSDHDYIMDIVLIPSRALILRNVHL
ncbi:hypothetical protein ACHAWU_010051 [Discostella pseudostelligera]|uniref:5-formyltetrahydrofolate cyclo-ligase n=1 Tax=Discostella pseudostelligera TaxID=259834 RepID=A0ABD3N6K1_9STRA